MVWENPCEQCEKTVTVFCFGCMKCWDCVDRCSARQCIECYAEDEIIRMKAVWEQRFKPHIECIMGTRNGYNAAMILACHSCEHAYKAIRKPKSDEKYIMQKSLESVLRLHDFSLAQEFEDIYKFDEKPHWCRQFAWEVRECMNSLKHDGIAKAYLEREAIKYNIEIRDLLMPGIRMELEIDKNIAQSGKPKWKPESRDITLLPRPIINHIISGIDKAYSVFTTEDSSHLDESWFSPALCKCEYGKCSDVI